MRGRLEVIAMAWVSRWFGCEGLDGKARELGVAVSHAALGCPGLKPHSVEALISEA